jgi:2-phosphosulfolactate phosphatase
MTYFDQDNFDVRCEWGLAAVQHMAPPDVIIVVDVLSFTTSVTIAVARGALIYPYRWQDQSAVAYAEQRKAELATGRNRHEGRYCLAPSSLETIPASHRGRVAQ